jgi:hypothetical protein
MGRAVEGRESFQLIEPRLSTKGPEPELQASSTHDVTAYLSKRKRDNALTSCSLVEFAGSTASALSGDHKSIALDTWDAHEWVRRE